MNFLYMLWFNFNLWFIFVKPVQSFWTSLVFKSVYFVKNRGRVKRIKRDNFCPNLPTPFIPPLVSLHPLYYTIPTIPYTHRYIIFFSQTLLGLEPGSEPPISCSVILYSIHLTTKDLLQISPIFVVINLFGPRPSTPGLKKMNWLKKKKMNWFEKNKTENKIKP